MVAQPELRCVRCDRVVHEEFWLDFIDGVWRCDGCGKEFSDVQYPHET